MTPDEREEALAHLESIRYPNGDPGATDRSEGDCLHPILICDCGYESMAYDEVEHDCPLKLPPIATNMP